MKKIKRALISVYDKKDLRNLLKTLKKYNVEILSSGGTHKEIQKLGYKSIEVSNYTKYPEILDGRVKTLNPKSLGYLIATWEHRTFITSRMLQINPYDQYGVSAGKIFAKKYIHEHGG